MKIFGGILICISTAAIGLKIGDAERTRYRSLCGLIFALDFIIAEISCLLTSAKEMFEKLSVQAPEPINQFFCKCALCLETKTDSSLTQIWQEEISKADYLHLKEPELQLFSEVAVTFGRYRADEQVALLKGIRTQLESIKEVTKEEQGRNVRVYRSLGIACGIALAILLI